MSKKPIYARNAAYVCLLTLLLLFYAAVDHGRLVVVEDVEIKQDNKEKSRGDFSPSYFAQFPNSIRQGNTHSSFVKTVITSTTKANLFTTGYDLGIMRTFWFPEYAYAGEFRRTSNSNPNDILLVGMQGTKLSKDHIYDHFHGKVLFVNGEPMGNMVDAHTSTRFYQVGGPVQDTNQTLKLYHGARVLLQFQPKSMWPMIFDRTERPQWSGNLSQIIYFTSKCHKHRQEAASELLHVVPLDAYGRCSVPFSQIKRVEREFPDLHLQGHWDNWKLYRHYKYCLVMENTAVEGYISEKIVWAFLGGCLPIYWGTTEVFDVFHSQAFLFYQPNTTAAYIQYLETNRTAYNEHLAAPILANGLEIIEKYFSLTDEVGGGLLKKKIRNMMSLPNGLLIGP